MSGFIIVASSIEEGVRPEDPPYGANYTYKNSLIFSFYFCHERGITLTA